MDRVGPGAISNLPLVCRVQAPPPLPLAQLFMRMRTSLHNLSVGLVLSVLSTCATPASAQEADAKLNAFFKQYLEETFRQRPMEATQLGDHRFDDKLDDLSPTARKQWVEHARQTLAQLPKEVDYQKLSRAAQIDLEILQQ